MTERSEIKRKIVKSRKKMVNKRWRNGEKWTDKHKTMVWISSIDNLSSLHFPKVAHEMHEIRVYEFHSKECLN